MADERIFIKEAIVVEGKYDKIKIASIFNAVIIVLDGFSIYRDKEKMMLLRHYAKTVGLIILTDSDSAGFRIRRYLKGAIKGNVKNVYVPDIFGKEKRKVTPSKEGKLGVEGIDKDIIINAFKNADISMENREIKNDITKFMLYEIGLSGKKDSADLREKLLKSLNLPSLLTANSMLEVLNTMMTADELILKVNALKNNI